MPEGEPYIIGLDLGQARDPTAVAVLDCEEMLSDGMPVRDARGRPIRSYDVVHLVRFPLGTSYPALVASVCALARDPKIQARGKPRLAIDATGVGLAAVDAFLDAKPPAECCPITIVGGTTVTSESWNRSGVTSWRVPKLDLVGAVQIGLGSGRLKIVPGLALAETLKNELLGFQVKVTLSANEQYGCWRDGQHDDIVLAVALGLWLGESARPRISRMV